ncbi:MAG: lamin tail domain-containing protein [Anaerolineales bacterium]|nr:lamin tail domain-containing protein [Anaerolineales bacterium]
MKRGGGFFVVAGCAFFLLGGFAPRETKAYQGSETETATATASDLFLPTPTSTETGSPIGTNTPTLAASATATETGTASGTPEFTRTGTLSPTCTTTPSGAIDPTATETLTDSPAPTPTESPTATSSLTPGSSAAWVVISEVAWAGTAASANDEWIELWNPGGEDVDVSGWTLTDNGDIRISLAGTIGAGGYYLLERTDDTTVGDIPADRIYTGALANSGEAVWLIDSSGRTVDSANGDGGAWPAGAVVPYGSMERRDPGGVSDPAWCSNDGIHRNGEDAGGNPVNGTPRAPFSGYCGDPTPTASATRTPTATSTFTPSLLQTPFAPHAVVINEVAWAGTAADSSDEWIELWNPGPETVSLSGWRLTDGGDVDIVLEGSIDSGGFFLLERGGDDTLSDIPADQLYSGALSNSGEGLLLLDPGGNPVDSAGERGRAWPAGSASPAYASMERVAPERAAWMTNTGWVTNGRDSAGNPIRGTPGRPNSALFPTPTRTQHPKTVLVNEFLPKPGSDWNRDGSVDYNDEFIELYNAGTLAVDIGGWMLDDQYHGGSRPFAVPGGTWIGPQEFLVFFRSQTRIALNESGDEIWLLTPDGNHVDGRVFTRTRWEDSAWARFPDGESVLRLGFPPTPGEPNRLPDDLLNPKKEPVPTIAEGWRRVMCGPQAGPLLVGAGVLTAGDEDSLRMAEAYGWYSWESGKCYAWTAPIQGSRFPYSNFGPSADGGLAGFDWWWDWRFFR